MTKNIVRISNWKFLKWENETKQRTNVREEIHYFIVLSGHTTASWHCDEGTKTEQKFNILYSIERPTKHAMTLWNDMVKTVTTISLSIVCLANTVWDVGGVHVRTRQYCVVDIFDDIYCNYCHPYASIVHCPMLTLHTAVHMASTLDAHILTPHDVK